MRKQEETRVTMTTQAAYIRWVILLIYDRHY